MKSSSRLYCFSLVILCLALTPFTLRAQEASKRLPFGDDLGAALQASMKDKKVTVLYFTANWCTWCKKIEQQAFRDERILGMSDRFHWVKIDIDVKREVAAMFGIRGVPRMILLNIRGETLADLGGYITADDLLAKLTEHVTNGEEAGAMTSLLKFFNKIEEDLQSKDEARKAKAALELLKKMAQPEFKARRYALTLIAHAGPAAYPGLLENMASIELRTRSAAFEALRMNTQLDLPFDVFASAELRAQQLDAWKEAMKDYKKSAPATQPAHHH